MINIIIYLSLKYSFNDLSIKLYLPFLDNCGQNNNIKIFVSPKKLHFSEFRRVLAFPPSFINITILKQCHRRRFYNNNINNNSYVLALSRRGRQPRY